MYIHAGMVRLVSVFLKRIISVLCAFTMVFSFIPTFVPEARAADAYEYGYSLLKTDYERTAYRAISDGIRNCERTIEFGIAPKNYQESLKQQYVQEILAATQKALRLVMADHPEYFWYDGDGSLTIEHDSWTTFKVIFETHEYSVNGKTVTKSNVNQYIQQVENVAKQILKDMPTDSDLRKIHHLHDYLTTHIEYELDSDDQTIYGALVEGKAVCAGYARAYQYLLTLAGIRCWYVTGNSISPTTMNKVAHAWNLVYLNGKCYYTDVTWDDQAETFHAYYMISKSEMGESHFPDHPEELPASCGHTDLDYFEVHKGVGTGVGMLTGEYNVADFAACMTKVSDDTWHCHVEDLTGGGLQPFVTWLRANERSIAAALGIEGGFSWWLDSIWDEYHVAFKSLPKVHYHDTVLYGVSYKAPTCTASGNKQYFVCNGCGTWFENWDGTGEIHDKESVKIPALEHNYSKQMQDANQHWKVCKGCGAEKSDSREFHYDTDRNGKCDVCNARVEVPTEPTTGATTPPATQPNTPPASEPTSNPSEQPSTEPTQETTQQPTDVPVTDPSEGQDSQPTEPGASVSPTESAQPEEASILTAVVVSCTVGAAIPVSVQ